MKRILLLCAFAATTFVATAQTNKDDFKPYVSIGTNLSSSSFSYGAEAGFYNNNTWFSVATSVSQDSAYTNHWVGSFKYYRRVVSSGRVDTYGYGAVNVNIDRSRTLSFEPGVAVVINVGKLAPQFSLGIPIYENTSFKVSPLNFGVGVNYWIK